MRSLTKSEIAADLVISADAPNQVNALAAIHALGELGGPAAVKQIEQLMDDHDPGGINDQDDQERWAALLRAYGRAGRYLPD